MRHAGGLLPANLHRARQSAPFGNGLKGGGYSRILAAVYFLTH
ncbi:hypothetical protein SME20J_35190 [Serratia marcescens]|jgi:hypothetical protein|nr:hypothetical protein SME20J_35190 [Serratia marcescens]